MKKTITPAQISAFRLARHHLIQRKPTDLFTLCRDVCGVQAQVLSAAEMAWWARNHQLTRAQIQAALWNKRTLIKTYALRGTLHILTAKDFPVYVSALQRSQGESTRKIMARVGLSVKEIAALETAAMNALQAGPLTQGELTEQVKSRVGKKTAAAIAKFWNIFRPLFSAGLICYGPPRGQEVTFIRVERWLPSFKEIAEPEAREILLRRYLRAYGPAAPQDFSRWTGIAMNEVKTVFAALMSEVREVESASAKSFILREDYEQLRASKMPEASLRLLPSFDPFMLGHVDKSLLVDEKNYKRVYRNQGWLSHVVLRNGKVLGVWNYERKSWRLAIAPFEKFSRATRALIRTEAESLAKFLEMEWEVIKFEI